uniref:Uncharacterized protein n=1 Tax=Salarias fasciatus TaxID=181472 RepID=A0A672FAQ5_SALFA
MIKGLPNTSKGGLKAVSLAASVQVQVEPVGRWSEDFVKRRSRNVSASFQELEEEEESSEESEDEELQLQEHPLLRTLHPKDWKVREEDEHKRGNTSITALSRKLSQCLWAHLEEDCGEGRIPDLGGPAEAVD